jgi:CTP:molybdopterin cytidylyltransferase MocA
VSLVAAVVLAAGAATRFGSPKQQLLLPTVLDRLASSPVDEVVVVEGAYRLRGDSPHDRTRVVRCEEWERGPGASLRCGLATLGKDVAAAVVARACWDGIPDDGLRVVTPRLVPCDDLGAPGDVDTPDDLAGMRGR